MSWAGATTKRRIREPNTWSVGLLLMLSVVLVWHQALVRFIYGRPHHFLQLSTNSTAITPTVAPLLPTAPPATMKPLPNHAPVDPFRPLVAADGGVASPATIRLPGWSARHPAASRHLSRPVIHHSSGTPGSCAATYVVRSGDSLWSIASANLHSNNWHELYAANRSRIGDNPSYLAVGERLCLPQS
jgi:hypothetical protein